MEWAKIRNKNEGEGIGLWSTDSEWRRFEAQRGLETLVVQTVNKAIISAKARKVTKDGRLPSTAAKLKSKKKGGIEKSSRLIALNSITHEKPYYS